MNQQTDMFPDQLKNSLVVKLAQKQLRLQELVELKEHELSQLKEELKGVEEQELPDAMADLEMSKFTLDNGAEIKIKPFCYASIPVEKRDAAYAWLRENGHGSLIKNEVKCEFGKDSEDEVKALETLLKDSGYAYEQKETIHASTLKAFVNEQVDQGCCPPADCFTITLGNKAVIKKG